MLQLIIKHRGRDNIPTPVLRAKVKASLDSQWDRLQVLMYLCIYVFMYLCLCLKPSNVELLYIGVLAGSFRVSYFMWSSA